MKDKEKQIEEMVFDLTMIVQRDYYGHILFNETAQRLYEQGYQKLPEDSVVLSREEYKNLKHYENEMYRLQGVVDTLTNEGWDILDEKEEKIRKVERKETAEKFVNLPKSKILTVVYDYEEIKVVELKELQEIAKQFGVEIKE